MSDNSQSEIKVRPKNYSGTLIYLMGPSGAGKDSLIERAKEAKLKDLVVATRLVTRETNIKTDDLYLSEEAFQNLLSKGRLALHWASHGFLYGIDKSIDTFLNQGQTVIINGSRNYLPTARQLYPHLKPILITAHIDILKARLLNRDREDQTAIMERLLRTNESFDLPMDEIKIIDNSGPLDKSSVQFINLLKELINQK
ncbi:MAG: phosphonate metabolism protein/1,5-bisphosphokinase (PRPP-forming) PhnN [Deltaproteobacteria bacterium]|jgi:ribose 1,5-bisphosphokinase|nr:phosphonate metabolism protein/1,5-bisphosphokinase (PRPP-forming) PhnN [Deltaproteobacteria bacterium]